MTGVRTRASHILWFDFIVERMFCCFCGNSLEARFVYFPTCGKKKNDLGPCGASTSSATHCDSSREDRTMRQTIVPVVHSQQERIVYSRPSVARTSQSKEKDDVLINVGLII